MDEWPKPKSEHGPEQAPRAEYVSLAKELSKSPERFPFPGIESEAYTKLKAESDEFPGLAAPIDDLIERFKQHGMKVATNLAENPGNLEVCVLPGDSDDIENDGIAPKHFALSGVTNAQLARLITLGKTLGRK